MNRKSIAALGALVLAATALGGCAAVFSKHPVGNTAVPLPAKAVVLNSYLGRWYEVARYEQGFQKDCDGVTADYALRDDGKISVINTCRKPDGTIKRANGKAKVVDTATGAKLKVSFFGPFYGDYWVLDHADDYSWSIVGEGSGRYLWLLSREANPGQGKMDMLIARAKALGYDTAMLRMTRQP
ncbi:MAG: lipocalin family protein [Novosphingobium sp.]|uniref:lipocalin family protein n=1 Tax=Novosphingobium sp. TaxID=1874826 RepID=UPI003C7D03F6